VGSRGRTVLGAGRTNEVRRAGPRRGRRESALGAKNFRSLQGHAVSKIDGSEGRRDKEGRAKRQRKSPKREL